MIPITSVFIIIYLSVLITRVASIILVYAGLFREAALFQARSAFSGAGLTTSESEWVGNHPGRRKVLVNAFGQK